MQSGWECVCSALRLCLLSAVITVGGCSGVGDAPPDDTGGPDPSQPPPEDSDSPSDTTDPSDDSKSAVWSAAFDATGVGVLSAVW